MKCSIRNFDGWRGPDAGEEFVMGEIIINYVQSIDQSEDDCSLALEYRVPSRRVGQVCVC